MIKNVTDNQELLIVTEKWTKFNKDNSLELSTGYQQNFVKAFIKTNTSGQTTPAQSYLFTQLEDLPDDRKPKRLHDAFMFIIDSYKVAQVHCKTAYNCGYRYIEPQLIKQLAVQHGTEVQLFKSHRAQPSLVAQTEIRNYRYR